MTNQEFLEQLGIEFKIARIRKRLSQKDLAKLIGLSDTAIGNVESGKIDCKILTYKRIADALELDIKGFMC